MRLAVRVFQRFQEDQTRDVVTVAAEILDRDALVQTAGDSIEGLVSVIVRERRAAPLEEPDQRAPQVLVALTSARRIRIETCEQPLEGWRVEPGAPFSERRRGVPIHRTG